MKKLISACLCGCVLAGGASAADSIVETIRTDGSTNSWTAADLSDALGLINRKYWRDMQTASGRVSWHGKLVKQNLYSDLKILEEVYEDGFCWTNEIKQAASGLKTTKDIPARLKEIQAKRVAEKAKTNVVVQIVNVNETKERTEDDGSEGAE